MKHGTCDRCGDETTVTLAPYYDAKVAEAWLCKRCYLNEPPSPGNRSVYQATMNTET